jgi:hypothetical protein
MRIGTGLLIVFTLIINSTAWLFGKDITKFNELKVFNSDLSLIEKDGYMKTFAAKIAFAN